AFAGHEHALRRASREGVFGNRAVLGGGLYESWGHGWPDGTGATSPDARKRLNGTSGGQYHHDVTATFGLWCCSIIGGDQQTRRAGSIEPSVQGRPPARQRPARSLCHAL